MDLGHCSVWSTGKPMSINENKKFKEGDYVRMKVDLKNNEIEWFKKPEEGKNFCSVGKISISQKFKGKTLYPTITMRHMDDTVRLLE